MMDKYLKIFGLDNNFSLDELEGRYKKLLKEFDTKNIEDDLKIIFLEEQVRIREAYQILLKHYHEKEKVSPIESKSKTLPVKSGKGGKKKKILPIIITICILTFLALALNGFFTSEPAESFLSTEELNLKELQSNKGLEGRNWTWQWKDNILKNKRNNTNDTFSKTTTYLEDVDKENDLINFLEKTKPIPKSVLEEIKEYILKYKEDKEKEVKRKKKKAEEDKRIEKEKKAEEKKKAEKKRKKEEKRKAEEKKKTEKKNMKSDLVKLMPGCWSLKHQWKDCTGDWNDGEFCFKSNGIMNSPDVNWTWDLNGNNISIISENGTKYTGVYKNGFIIGTIISYEGMNGCFRLYKK